MTRVFSAGKRKISPAVTPVVIDGHTTLGMPGPLLLEQLIKKIKAHEARVGIVGLGYVGLPLVWP